MNANVPKICKDLQHQASHQWTQLRDGVTICMNKLRLTELRDFIISYVSSFSISLSPACCWWFQTEELTLQHIVHICWVTT